MRSLRTAQQVNGNALFGRITSETKSVLAISIGGHSTQTELKTQTKS